MKVSIPAKTFLLGEYVALQGGPAILLTTTPCFEVGLSTQKRAAIHPASPAGRFWESLDFTEHLTWVDPYQGMGGLGASSAEFLGAYYLSLLKTNQKLIETALLDAYWAAASISNSGVRPSGYDVLAQASSGCVYLNHQQSAHMNYSWPFHDIAFVLLHTGKKVETHKHLQSLALTEAVSTLSPIAALGKEAFDAADSMLLIQAVNSYYQQLLALDLVALHTQIAIKKLADHEDILAIKGCGALGADVLLLLVPKTREASVIADMKKDGFFVLGSLQDLYLEKNLLEM